MKFIIFDLDDTLLCGDCEAGWINFLVIKGLLDGDEHSSKLNQFDIDYRRVFLILMNTQAIFKRLSKI